MNLNKLLCKHIDYGDKGYVTLGDVVRGACSLTFSAAFGIMVGYMYFRGALLVIQSDIPYGALISGDDAGCVVMFTFINAVIILVGAAIVARKLASIRVVTCERK